MAIEREREEACAEADMIVQTMAARLMALHVEAHEGAVEELGADPDIRALVIVSTPCARVGRHASIATTLNLPLEKAIDELEFALLRLRERLARTS